MGASANEQQTPPRRPPSTRTFAQLASVSRDASSRTLSALYSPPRSGSARSARGAFLSQLQADADSSRPSSPVGSEDESEGGGCGGGEATHVHIGGPPSTRGNDAATGTGIAPWGSPVTVSSGGGRSEGGSPGKPGSGGRGRASSERMGSPASLGVDLKERLRRARSSTSSRYDDIWGTGYGVFMPTGHFTPHTHARIASLHTPRGAWWE